ncbi:hypothetical protein [Pseudomonas viridiflava]|uniref:hypothetical protein n=1 Tax=Pseudomonas viridiflava TaxID=33069 RepID=UPI001C312381|nr:hypothetical protein [Pseudomonas viridiflava]QXG49198.1 hypothetical protein KTT57_09350 [Pseudomonas viridiflava]
MTVDIEKLEALAKAASQGNWNQDGFDVQNDDIEDYRVSRCKLLADAKFIAAANPAAVLQLTQTIRDLKSSVQGLKTGYEAYERVNAELRAECETLRENVTNLAVELVRESDKVAALTEDCAEAVIARMTMEIERLTTHIAGGLDSKAIAIKGMVGLAVECEKLRKDAERYQWLRDESESIHQFYLSTPIWFTGVKFSKENVDSTIDAAMSKEQSHD